MLHGKVFEKDTPELENVKQFVKKYEEFYEFGEDNEHDMLWHALKDVIKSDVMPKNPWDRWPA